MAFQKMLTNNRHEIISGDANSRERAFTIVLNHLFNVTSVAIEAFDNEKFVMKNGRMVYLS